MTSKKTTTKRKRKSPARRTTAKRTAAKSCGCAKKKEIVMCLTPDEFLKMLAEGQAVKKKPTTKRKAAKRSPPKKTKASKKPVRKKRPTRGTRINNRVSVRTSAKATSNIFMLAGEQSPPIPSPPREHYPSGSDLPYLAKRAYDSTISTPPVTKIKYIERTVPTAPRMPQIYVMPEEESPRRTRTGRAPKRLAAPDVPMLEGPREIMLENCTGLTGRKKRKCEANNRKRVGA